MTVYSKYKDYKLRENKQKNEKILFLLKSFLYNQKNSKKIRFKIMLKMNSIFKDVLGIKQKNRCMITTKVRAVSRLTNLTKSSFRDNLRIGQVSGFRKASW